jgi:hypothetical protein
MEPPFLLESRIVFEDHGMFGIIGAAIRDIFPGGHLISYGRFSAEPMPLSHFLPKSHKSATRPNENRMRIPAK